MRRSQEKDDKKKREMRRQNNRTAVRQYRERKRETDQKVRELVIEHGKRMDDVEKLIDDLHNELLENVGSTTGGHSSVNAPGNSQLNRKDGQRIGSSGGTDDSKVGSTSGTSVPPLEPKEPTGDGSNISSKSKKAQRKS